jgi:hypothetical protein
MDTDIEDHETPEAAMKAVEEWLDRWVLMRMQNMMNARREERECREEW